MKKMYLAILQIVIDVTGVTYEDMFSSNHEEHVDARHILIYVLSDFGFSDAKISEFTKLSRAGVCIIRNRFNDRRLRYFVDQNYHDVVKRVEALKHK